MGSLAFWFWPPCFCHMTLLSSHISVMAVVKVAKRDVTAVSSLNCALYTCSCVASKGTRKQFFFDNKKVIIFVFRQVWYTISLNMIKCHIFSLAVPVRENVWHFNKSRENIFHISLKRINTLLIFLDFYTLTCIHIKLQVVLVCDLANNGHMYHNGSGWRRAAFFNRCCLKFVFQTYCI
jgi:hypothetical protein